jgi:hypothetical protein
MTPNFMVFVFGGAAAFILPEAGYEAAGVVSESCPLAATPRFKFPENAT